MQQTGASPLCVHSPGVYGGSDAGHTTVIEEELIEEPSRSTKFSASRVVKQGTPSVPQLSGLQIVDSRKTRKKYILLFGVLLQ